MAILWWSLQRWLWDLLLVVPLWSQAPQCPRLFDTAEYRNYWPCLLVCHVPVAVHRSAGIKRTWCSCYVPSVYTCFHVYFLSFFSALYCVTWENMPLFLVDYSVDKDSPLRPVSNFLWMNSVLSTPFSALTLSVWWLTLLSLFTLYFCSVVMWYCISYVPNNKADVWRH